MKLRSTIAFALAFAAITHAEDLPRKVKTPRESYPNVDVIYDSVKVAEDGNRLRTIITKPRGAKKKMPVIFVASWLSCDSVEAPADTKDETGLVFRGLAQLPGFVLFRVDKQGVGDSEGVCSETDFEYEFAGYRAAFRAMKNYDFIDTNKIYILGISNGGGFAPLFRKIEVEGESKVRGYISVGGWVKTWFEHMMEIERRRFALMGKLPAEMDNRMKGAATLYHEWLIKGRAVDAIFKDQPELADLWPEGKDHFHLYGRPLAFYKDLQDLNLADEWSRVKVPTYVLRGAFDWIMTREDSELIATYVNRNGDLATFYEIPQTGHTFQHYLSLADAFKGKSAPFDPKVVTLLSDCFTTKQSPMKIKNIAFVGIPVTDIKRARSFYEGALGLKPSAGFSEGVWIEYEIGHGTLAIGSVGDQWKPSSDGTSVALEVDDLDAAVKRLKKANVPFDTENVESPVCRMAVVQDPDGNKIIIHKLKSK